MNTYYSNLIEGHNTRPRDIERALVGNRDDDQRDLLQEAVAHYRVQQEIDRMAMAGDLPDPAHSDLLRKLHHDFHQGASEAMLTVKGRGRTLVIEPRTWRRSDEEDVQNGNHVPPSSTSVPAFMDYF